MLLTATFGAAAAKNSNATSRNSRNEFGCENTAHNPLMEHGSLVLLNIPQLTVPPFEISRIGTILKITILSSLLGFSFIMARKSNLEL